MCRALHMEVVDSPEVPGEGELASCSSLACASEDSLTACSWDPPGDDPRSSPEHPKHADETSVDALLWDRQKEAAPCGYLSSTQAGSGMAACHRAAVVDCLVTSSARLGLSNDSLFLGVALLDRFLAARPLPLHLLQPAGVACLWVASKFEEQAPPAPSDFAGLMLALNGGPLPQAPRVLVSLEASILDALDFKLAGIVTARTFKQRLLATVAAQHARPAGASSGGGASLCALQLQQLACMTSYLTEVSLLEYELLPCLPSMVAAAAYAYAHALLGLRLNKDALQAASGHTLLELDDAMCWISELHRALSRAVSMGRPLSVSLKYASPLAHGASLVPALSGVTDPRLARW